MNKSELIDSISEYANMSKVDSGKALDAVLKSIKDSLVSGEPVVLVGFGSFVVKDRAARTGRNPQTGKPLDIAASKVPGFRPGKSLKEAMNS